jgi:hypothetical protein
LALGLDRLKDAPALGQPQLAEIAERSQAARSRELATAETTGPRIVPGQVVDGGVFLSDFEAAEEGVCAWVEANGICWPAGCEATDGGSLILLGDHRASMGLHELRSGLTTIAYVLLNDGQALKAAALPRDSARILHHLGTLESGTGFTELLDLLDKHVLAPTDGSIGASRTTIGVTQAQDWDVSEASFGPRGVSLPVETELGLRRPRLNDGLIAEIIAALIRALGGPTIVPATDGDAPDLDEGDADDAPSTDKLARNLDAAVDAPEIDWPRLVTACRKRLTVMLKRLEDRLNDAMTADYPPNWALGRLVVVLSLLHRLRAHPPQTRDAISGRVRPTSLVSAAQLGFAFSLAVRALYGPGNLALKLESDPDTRCAEERRLIDNLLLWFAREIGADCFCDPRDQVDAEDLQARADLGPVVMSAASYGTLEAWAVLRDPWLGFWDDAETVADDWIERHIAYGHLLQRLRGQPRVASTRVPVVGDIVLWAGERDLPWVVTAVNGHKMILIEAGGVKGAKKNVLVKSVSVLDLANLLEDQTKAVA